MRIRGFGRGMLGIRSERAAALVEFALVVPLLMMIMCATIDFGLAVYTLNNLTAAVREGGRYAATIPQPGPTTNDANVRDRVYKYIVGMNNGLTQVQVKNLISVSAPDINGNITIQVTGYPYKPVTPLANVLGLGTISLNRRAIFRWEMANSS